MLGKMDVPVGFAGWGSVRSPSPGPLLSALVSLPLGKGKALGERIRNANETAMI